MPLNVPGLLVPLQLLWNPRLIVPAICVDIRQLDFLALKKAGYRGAVFDKDNCLTIPYKDELVPELNDAWKECKQVFGKQNVLVVSNSAGTHLDGGGIQAESVSYHLGVPVLMHTSMKPSYSCIKSIRQYYSSLQVPVRDDQLLIVGDRLFTDITLANRMRSWHGWRQFLRLTKNDPTPTQGPLAIWTTGVWQKEATAMRWGEARYWPWCRMGASCARYKYDCVGFIRELPQPPESPKRDLWGGVLKIVGLRLALSRFIVLC
ncbi:mitochondrial PGP phosphatase-domain-containing protein [Mucidula mucida]|nr:mitochondrial PGP phosphatase-domain-containing protein [Mucidula mucida]